MKRQLIVLTLIATSIFFTSCGNFLKEYSQDLLVPKTPAELDEVLVGGIDGYLPSLELAHYSNMTGSFFNILDDDVNSVITTVALADWLTMQNSYFGYTTWQLEVGRNLVGNSVSDDEFMWIDLYHRINSMNILLKQLGELSNITTEQDKLAMERIKGECLFLRAQFYFTLSNIYGKAYSPLTADKDLAVPLKLTEYVVYDKEKEVIFPRNTVKEVYEQIILDLKASIEAFNNSPQLRPQFRASREAALLLLSRVYLYKQDWKNAKMNAEEVLKINNQLMNLAQLPKETIIMSESNPEILFTQGSLFAQLKYVSGLGAAFCVSKDLYDLYEEHDLRKSHFFEKNTTTDSIAMSWKFRTDVRRSPISDVFLLRTAEAYLNAAEASAMLGNESDAKIHLEQLRKYRYVNPEPLQLAGENLVKEIRNERRRELCFEGHRWFDLRRYAADVKYPMKKEIKRIFARYDYENRNQFIAADVYTLLIDDPAYVFQIPKNLLDSEPQQIPNEREAREPEALTPPDEETDLQDGDETDV